MQSEVVRLRRKVRLPKVLQTRGVSGHVSRLSPRVSEMPFPVFS